MRAFKRAAISKQSLPVCSLHHSPTLPCLKFVRLFFLGSPVRSCTHSSVLFPSPLSLRLSWVLVSLTYYTLNFHIHGFISMFFQYFPINSPLHQTRPPKISLPLTHSHRTVRHSAATLRYSTPHFSASPASCSPSLANPPRPHTLQAPQLCLPTCCTSLSSSP